MARARRGTARVPGLENTAFFTQYDNAYRDDGDRRGDIIIPLVDKGWFWFIPFKDGRTSVGCASCEAPLDAGAHPRARSPEKLFAVALSRRVHGPPAPP